MIGVPDIRVVVDDFRAINHAEIIVNGITVVAGENGSGKSSISKLLYFLYRTVAGYDAIVKRALLNDLRDVSQLLDIMFQEYKISDNLEVRDFPRRYSHTLRKSLMESEFIDDELTKWLNAISIVQESHVSNMNSDDKKIIYLKQNRINRILNDVLKPKENDLEMSESFSNLKSLVINLFDEAQKTINSRPTSLFIEELKEIFSEQDLPETFDVLEYGSPIISLNNDHLAIPYSIQNAIYIDSPMMFYAEGSDNQHWNDLIELLQQSGNENNSITDLIGSEIIQGHVDASDDTIFSTEDFKFRRNDGEIFNLLDVATGIKSFSILQLLLKNGVINDKTLMIIDEPESHLHPQWVIEYARVIVLMNKFIGVKFFLATHNPDMVSAIRYISEKEGTLEKVNYYLAEKASNKFKYNYKFLEKEIDPIFASFNIALERINQYGV